MLAKVPATVLTGYLGSGKTTLLNRILSSDHGKQIAVIVNEFGEIGIDNELIVSSDEEIVEVNNGCICCTVRGDLIRIVDDIFRRYQNLDHILIETTGLADPGPVIQSFFVDDRMASKLELDAIVTLVDSKHIPSQISSHEAEEQIAFADVIVLNKADLVSPDELDTLESEIRQRNTVATIFRACHADVKMENLLGIQGFDLKNVLSVAPDILSEDDHQHDDSIQSICIERTGAVDPKKFNRWLFDLSQEHGRNILRMKGILNVNDEPRRFVFQGVHMVIDTKPGRPWGSNETRGNELVFIGRHLGKMSLEEGFESCLKLS